MKLRLFNESDYPVLFEIVRQIGSFWGELQFDEFVQVMRGREGFVMLNTVGEAVGQIAFSDHVPAIDVRIHAFILPQYQGKWITEELCRQVFAFPFNQLKVRRLSGYCIKGLTDRGGGALEKLGFVREGCIRKGYKVADQFYDIVLYGMLREECRWA